MATEVADSCAEVGYTACKLLGSFVKGTKPS